MASEELNPDPVAICDAQVGDWVMWRSFVSRMLTLREVTRVEEGLIVLGEHLCFDHKGRCRSEFRHGHLVEPNRDRRLKYLRQRRLIARIDRIHKKRLDKANMEYKNEIDRWSVETIRDIAQIENEGERVETLLRAAEGYLKIL